MPRDGRRPDPGYKTASERFIEEFGAVSLKQRAVQFLFDRYFHWRLDQLTALEYRRLDILDAAALSPVDEESPDSG